MYLSNGLFFSETIHRYAVIGQKFTDKTNLKEEWYGTDYNLKPIEESVIQVSIKICGGQQNCCSFVLVAFHLLLNFTYLINPLATAHAVICP